MKKILLVGLFAALIVFSAYKISNSEQSKNIDDNQKIELNLSAQNASLGMNMGINYDTVKTSECPKKKSCCASSEEANCKEKKKSCCKDKSN